MNEAAHRDPIFKGATRPAMIFGVPIVAFVLVGGSHLLAGMWLLVLANPFWFFATCFVALAELFALRLISKHDPHRVSQTILWLMSWGTRRNSHTWGTHSMGPVEYKRRDH